MDKEIEDIKIWFEGIKSSSPDKSELIDKIVSCIDDSGFNADKLNTEIEKEIKKIGENVTN